MSSFKLNSNLLLASSIFLIDQSDVGTGEPDLTIRCGAVPAEAEHVVAGGEVGRHHHLACSVLQRSREAAHLVRPDVAVRLLVDPSRPPGAASRLGSAAQVSLHILSDLKRDSILNLGPVLPLPDILLPSKADPGGVGGEGEDVLLETFLGQAGPTLLA